MDSNFIAHIIRDIFPNTADTTLYGNHEHLMGVLHTPEHGIGAYLLHTERDKINENSPYKFWEIGINHMYFSDDTCDLFISFDYNPQLFNEDISVPAQQIKDYLKPGGLCFLVNPGYWANCLNEVMPRNNDIENEIKRYSMFKNQNVLVYENI